MPQRKKGGDDVHRTHHISRALITSVPLPLCLRWRKWRISTFHPSYLLYVLFLLCHSRARVINLLSAQAHRTLWSFLSCWKLILDSWASFWKFSCLSCSIPCQDPDQEMRQMEEEHIKRDRLTGQCETVLVTFKLIVKKKYEEKRKMECWEDRLRKNKMAFLMKSKFDIECLHVHACMHVWLKACCTTPRGWGST